MVSAPERDPIQFHTKTTAAQRSDKLLFGLEPAYHSVHQSVLSGEPYRLPGDLTSQRICLMRYQQPAVSSRQSSRNGPAALFKPLLCLPHLKWTEVKRLLIIQDGLPGQIVANGLFKVQIARIIGRQKNQGVAIAPGSAAPVLEKFLGPTQRRAVLV